ncbi:hypothetical protein D3C86_1417790 [compost metagenome]
MPELRAAFGIAIGAFFFHPHGAGQDQVGGLGGNGGVDVRDDDEVFRVAPAWQDFLHDVRPGVHVVAGLGPIHVEDAVLEHAALLHRVKTDFLLNGAGRQFPDLLCGGAVLGVGHYHVGGQTVGEGADLPSSATSRGLAGQREGAVARFADLAGEQVDVVDQVVGPHPACVLVETHGPERHDLAFGISIEFSQGLEAFRGNAGLFRGTFQGVGFDERSELLEGHVGPGIGLVGILRLFFPWIVRTQAVADVIGAFGEAGVLADEILIDRTAFNDVVGNVIEDQQVGLRLEYHGNIGQFETAMLEGRQHGDFHVRLAQAPVGDPAP